MRRSLALSAALVLLACEGLTRPDRTPGYTFDDFVGLHFHWPAERLPVRYWIAPSAGNVPDYVRAGIAVWRGQFLYGEFDGAVVPDSIGADVIVRVLPPNPPTLAVSATPPEIGACEGVTSFDTTSAVGGTRLQGPMEVEVRWDSRYAPADIVNCLYRVTLHELGHTLGIFSHSLDSLDLMNGIPRVADPSLNDRMTVQRVYHTPADLHPPAARSVHP